MNQQPLLPTFSAGSNNLDSYGIIEKYNIVIAI
jgi:hypothetical protein